MASDKKTAPVPKTPPGSGGTAPAGPETGGNKPAGSTTNKPPQRR